MRKRWEAWKESERQRWLDKQARSQEQRIVQPQPMTPTGLVLAIAAGVVIGGWLLYALIASV